MQSGWRNGGIGGQDENQSTMGCEVGACAGIIVVVTLVSLGGVGILLRECQL